MSTPQPYGIDRLSAGYASAPPDTRQRRRLAETYKPNPRMDQMAAWQETRPELWQHLDATTRLSVAHYQAAKEAHQAEQAAAAVLEAQTALDELYQHYAAGGRVRPADLDRARQALEAARAKQTALEAQTA